MSDMRLQRRQALAKTVHDKMLSALIGYDPVRDLRVSDVLFIAEYARTLAFDAMNEAKDDAP